MRITIVQPYPPDEQRSMLRFGDALAAALRTDGDVVRSVAPPVLFGRIGRAGSSLRKWSGYIDKYLLAWPRLWRARRWSDVVHVVDQGSAMYVHALDPARTLVTVHDLFAVEAYLGRIAGRTPGRAGRLQQRWILSGLRRARHFSTVSAATETAIRRIMGDARSIAVIPNALGPRYAPAPAAEVARARTRAGIPDGARYFIHVGSNSFYKNRTGVVRLFDTLAARPENAGDWLVLAGKAPDRALRAAIRASGAQARIAIVAEPTDREVVALYSGARALLFPSLMEGFGWPIIEAQACGCPVVTSDREPMRSVAGGAAILIPPDDAAAAADRIARRIADPGLVEDGAANAARFAPEAIYPRYRSAYAAIVASD